LQESNHRFRGAEITSSTWYTQEFAEAFFHPQQFFQLVPAVNTVLAGSEKQLPEVRWRLWIFHFLVFLQKRFAIYPDCHSLGLV
jgi:hypothetical protein